MPRVELGPYITRGSEHKIFEHPTDKQKLIKRPRWYALAVLNTLTLGRAARRVQRDYDEANALAAQSGGDVRIAETEVIPVFRGLSYRAEQEKIEPDNSLSLEDIRTTLHWHGFEEWERRQDRAPENFPTKDDVVVLIDPTINPLSRIRKTKVVSKYLSDEKYTELLKKRREIRDKIKEKTNKFRTRK